MLHACAGPVTAHLVYIVYVIGIISSIISVLVVYVIGVYRCAYLLSGLAVAPHMLRVQRGGIVVKPLPPHTLYRIYRRC
jgi:hypothetical protein